MTLGCFGSRFGRLNRPYVVIFPCNAFAPAVAVGLKSRIVKLAPCLLLNSKVFNSNCFSASGMRFANRMTCSGVVLFCNRLAKVTCVPGSMALSEEIAIVSMLVNLCFLFQAKLEKLTAMCGWKVITFDGGGIGS